MLNTQKKPQNKKDRYGSPLISYTFLTLNQFKSIVLPMVNFDKYACDTITDLWYHGAVSPRCLMNIHLEEERLIIPFLLATWLEEIFNRIGKPLDENARLYNDMVKGVRYPHVR